MALMLDEELDENVTTIKVIGVGGGGGNAVNPHGERWPAGRGVHRNEY